MKIVVAYFLLIVYQFDECKSASWTTNTHTKWSNRTIFGYHDIEYGAFSTEQGKFLPPDDWKMIADSVKSNLVQNEIKQPLHLSIFTTKLEARHPVMVYIPGFDLVSEASDRASPGFLLERDVVLVSIQYRHGAVGFLSTLSNDIPGNAAIFDILLALKWIQYYIVLYGGDPSRVTLFGQYKVAGLIHVLTLSELGKGLFHQVIYQSGSALLQNFTTADPLKYSREVAEILQCSNTENKIELNKCLTNSDRTELTQAFNYILRKYKANIPFVTIGGPSNVLDRSPEDIHRGGQFRIYPKMLGFVDQPSSYFLDVLNPSPNSFFTLDHYPNDAGEMIQLSTEAFGRTPLANMARNLTFTELKNVKKEVLKKMFNLLITSILDWSNFYIKSAIYSTGFLNKTPKTYAYAFKYQGQFHSLPRKDDNLLNDVTILDDNLYLFDRSDLELNAADRQIAETMVTLWTTFAESGLPRADRVKEWPEVKVGSDQYLSIDREISVERDFTNEFQSATNTFLED